MTLTTPADGAAAERQAWMRKVRRLIKNASRLVDKLDLMELEEWGKARHQRYQARPGGLGRKPAAK